MLLRAMFFLALIVVLAQTFVHGASALASATLHHRAVSAANAQFETAIATAQNALAQSAAAGGDIRQASMPSPTPTCAFSDGSGCALLAQSTITVAAAPPQAPGGCPNTNCTVYVQGNDAVSEGRVGVDVTTTVAAPNGATLASRSSHVTFRTFATPPYALRAGSLDASVNDIATGRTGDDGGAPDAASAGTLVRVEYRNASNPGAPPIPGNVWHPQEQSPALAASAWDH